MDTPLKNPKHEKFVQFVASGDSATVAYSKAGYKPKGKSARTAGPRLLANVGIQRRLQHLQKKTSEKIELSREALAKHLMAAVMTPIDEITGSSPLAQEMTEGITISGGSKGKLKRGKAPSGNETIEPHETVIRRRIKSMGKVESARLLCDMMGWKEPERFEHDLGEKTIEGIADRAARVASALIRKPKPKD